MTEDHVSQELEILRERAREYRDLLIVSYAILSKPDTKLSVKVKFFEALERHGLITEDRSKDGK